MVKIIGRDDLRLGPLTNVSDGGDFNKGYYHIGSKIVGAKISAALQKHPRKNSRVKKELWKIQEYRQKQNEVKHTQRYHDLISKAARKQMLKQWKDPQFIEKTKKRKTKEWRKRFSKKQKKWYADNRERLLASVQAYRYKVYGKETIIFNNSREVKEWCKTKGIYPKGFLRCINIVNRTYKNKGYYLIGGKKVKV